MERAILAFTEITRSFRQSSGERSRRERCVVIEKAAAATEPTPMEGHVLESVVRETHGNHEFRLKPGSVRDGYRRGPE